MKWYCIISLILILFSCDNNNNTLQDIYERDEREIIEDTTLFSSDKEDETFKYQLTYEKLENEVLKLHELVITRKSDKKEIQREIVEIEILEHDFYFSCNQDVNFDGYNDIAIVNFVGAYDNTTSFWVYDTLNNQFKYCKSLSEISNPIIIETEKQICSKYRIGLSEFYLEKYFWKNDSIVLSEKYEEIRTDQTTLTTTVLKNGNYISNTVISKEGIVEDMICLE